MEVFPIVSELLKSLLGWLPGFLLRWYYTPARLSQLIYIDLMPRLDPALLNLAPAASFQFNMQVINLSPFPVTLERAVIRVNFGTAPLEAINVERHAADPGQAVAVSFRGVLTDGHVGQIMENNPSNSANLSGTFEFICRLHPFTRRVPDLPGIQLKRVNEHTRKR